MRKILLVLLVLVIVGGLFLTGCNSNKTGVEAIKERGVLKVGVKVDVPKFGLKDTATGEIDGFEIDLVRQIAKEILGDETKLNLQE